MKNKMNKKKTKTTKHISSFGLLKFDLYSLFYRQIQFHRYSTICKYYRDTNGYYFSKPFNLPSLYTSKELHLKIPVDNRFLILV